MTNNPIEFADDDLFQFLQMVGDIADRIRSIEGCPVDLGHVTFLSCVLVSDFPPGELFRTDYDGMPNGEDECLLRLALHKLGKMVPEPFELSEKDLEVAKSFRNLAKRKFLDGHFNYVDTPKGVVVISHKETRIRRLLSKAEREFATEYYIHNVLDDVCQSCRAEMDALRGVKAEASLDG